MKRFEDKVLIGKLLCTKVETQDNTVNRPIKEQEKIFCFFWERKTMIAGAKTEDFADVLNNALK